MNWRANGTAVTFLEELHYYPFGMLMEGIGTAAVTVNAYKYNSKELNSDLGLDWSDYGARWYDASVGRWWSVDPLAEKYVGWSPYIFSLNDPINVIDPDGRDVILIVWATHDGNIGHAGVAVANYREVKERVKENDKWVIKTRMEHDGTYTYRDLWPGNEGGVGKANYDKDVEASYYTKTVTLDDLKNTDVTGSEGRSADGVIQLTTDFDTDQNVTKALDEFQSANPKYNGLSCNCSDFAEQGVESAAGKQLSVDEKLSDTKSATTPNQLWKATVGLPNATIVKNPGDKVKPNFLDGVTGGGKSADKARKKD